MSFFAGIDGGATRTDALITDAHGRPLARRQAPPALIRTLGGDVVAERLIALLTEALRAAGGELADGACFALTGVGREEEASAISAALRHQAVPARSWRIMTDAEAAIEDAFGGAPGIVVIAGTGSVAWATRPDGSSARSGGWGPLLGDEGSGWSIGAAALRATVRAADGREPATAVARAVLDATGCSDASRLVHWTDTASRDAIAALAPLVLGLANLDATADAIIDEAARELALLVPPLHQSAGPVRVALAGGLLAHGGPLRERLVARLGDMKDVTVHGADVDGARGAAALARRMVGTSRPLPAAGSTFGE